jgi:putative flippase GtrA
VIHALPQRSAHLRDLLLSPAVRPLRFAGTGGTAGALQLFLLTLLTSHGWNAVLANAFAFLTATQVNFALSLSLTWRDRCGAGSLHRRWLLFHGSIAVMALVNMLTFMAARSFLPLTAAALAGIAAGAVGNYLAGDRLVFRAGRSNLPPPSERRPAA